MPDNTEKISFRQGNYFLAVRFFVWYLFENKLPTRGEIKMKIDAARLRAAIEKSGLTTAEIAKAAGWESSRRVTQLMAGKSTNINPRIGEAIARKLKVKTIDIVKIDGDF
jgi:hypothetical protein